MKKWRISCFLAALIYIISAGFCFEKQETHIQTLTLHLQLNIDPAVKTNVSLQNQNNGLFLKSIKNYLNKFYLIVKKILQLIRVSHEREEFIFVFPLFVYVRQMIVIV